jgi:hypothetical protein
MKLLANQIDEASLSRFGEEVVSLLKKRDFSTLANRFDYAFTFERPTATALEEDLQTSIAACQGSSKNQDPVTASIVVKYFRPNKSGLFAVVESLFDATKGCPVLAELIVSSDGKDRYVTPEEISSATA